MKRWRRVSGAVHRCQSRKQRVNALAGVRAGQQCAESAILLGEGFACRAIA